MKQLLTFLSVLLVFVSFSQEETGPITQMPFAKKRDAAKPKSLVNTIDSTFSYNPDTLDLPFFDEFSTKKIQVYDADYGDPGVTSEEFFKLLDASNNPLPGNTVLTSQLTYRTLINTDLNTTTNQNFLPVQLKDGDFTSFPVLYTSTLGYPPYIILDTVNYPNDPDTIWLSAPEFRQDSATIFFADVNDPQYLWLEDDAYHNFTFAINPRSLGVMTFDGLDANGYPYQFGTEISGVGDYLTSKSLNMGELEPQDSVYLSFLVQRGGYGEEPEPEDDFILEFRDAASGDWTEIWSLSGGTDIERWRVVNIPVKAPQYFQNGFQFRFKNNSGLSGSLDHFHLDYVYLRENGGWQDSIFEDFAWSYPVGSLIKDYTSVPWDHWKNSFDGRMNDSTKVGVFNSYLVNQQPDVSQLIVEHPQTGTSVYAMNVDVITGDNPAQDYNAYSYTGSYHDLGSTNRFPATVTGDEAVFNITGIATIQQPNYAVNDTCYTTQVFSDYYSYDDGSAEKAYGIIGVQARLAIRFNTYEVDSIIGVRMHFVPSVNDVSDKLFLLTVWGDNNGHPGSVIYEDQFFQARTPQYEDAIGKFTEYFLPDTMKLEVPQTFYVGWRQVDQDRLNVGLDMNNDNSHNTFFTINGGATWSSSDYDGSVMIRPIFSTQANIDLGTEEIAASPEWEVYPNPTTGIVAIDWRNDRYFPGAVCRDVQGRIVGTIEEGDKLQKIDLGGMPAGLYFIQLNGFEGAVKKVIRN
jgi:hypothetical protein